MALRATGSWASAERWGRWLARCCTGVACNKGGGRGRATARLLHAGKPGATRRMVPGGAAAALPPCCPPQGAPNVLPAREFVWWYNGHPDCRDLPVDLSEVRGGSSGCTGAAPDDALGL
jgi:hypothetical protein